MKFKRTYPFLVGLVVSLFVVCGGESCADRSPDSSRPSTQVKAAADSTDYGKVLVTNSLDISFSKYLVTFVELGAERCIPCKKMQPIMKEIAETFSDQVQVVFYDVRKDPRPAWKYGIQIIPTQVFIDQNGREVFRHVGFFPKEEILELLKKHGIY